MKDSYITVKQNKGSGSHKLNNGLLFSRRKETDTGRIPGCLKYWPPYFVRGNDTT
jgi:hypothetical protein